MHRRLHIAEAPPWHPRLTHLSNHFPTSPPLLLSLFTPSLLVSASQSKEARVSICVVVLRACVVYVCRRLHCISCNCFVGTPLQNALSSRQLSAYLLGTPRNGPLHCTTSSVRFILLPSYEPNVGQLLTQRLSGARPPAALRLQRRFGALCIIHESHYLEA